MAATRHVVGPLDAFPPGSRRSVSVKGRAVAVFNVGGVLYALRDRCPHQGAELSGGDVVGAVDATGPGCYRYDASRRLVKCPWHGWEFDLATGQSWFDPRRHRVRRYEASVESGDTLLGAPPAEADAPVRGELVAETIPVSVEHDYVVIEL